MAFTSTWFLTVFAGVVVGIPVLLVLRKLGLNHRLDAMLIGGLGAGTFFAAALGFLATGRLSLTDDPLFTALGSGAGLGAGGLWWLLMPDVRSTNG